MVRGGRRVAAFGLCVAGIAGGLGVLGVFAPGCAVGDGGDTGPVITYDSGGVDTNVAVDSGGHDTSVPDDTAKTDTTVDDTATGADTKDSGTDSTVADTGADTKDSGTDSGADTRDAGADTADSATPDTADAIGPSDALSTCVNKGYTGALVVYDLTGKTGSETSDAATTVALGLTAGSLTRAPALTATAGADSMNSSGWGTPASPAVVDKTKYLTFTVTPASGCVLSLSSLVVDVKSSGTGPSAGSVGTNVDTFSSLGIFGANSVFTVTIGGVSGASGAIEIRVYGYGASSSAGTMRVQNTMTLNGKLD